MKHLFMILALSVLLAATAQAQCPCDVELLQNPGCDESLVGGEIPGWTEVVGNARHPCLLPAMGFSGWTVY